MGQLIRATSIPLKTVHFSRPARLVSTDSVDIERRKAIARFNAMRLQYASTAGAGDYRYVQEINQAFSQKLASAQINGGGTGTNYPVPETTAGQHADTTVQSSSSPVNLPRSSQEASYQQSMTSTISEPQAAYTVQRGAFELRVAKGELSYVPPLDMTIIVQYPGVEFEYLGDFNYVPPHKDDVTND